MRRIPAMLLLCVLLCVQASAEGFVDPAQEYRKMLDRYEKALYPGILQEDAIEEFRDIKAIYEAGVQGGAPLDSFQDAKRYYDYACGRIAFYEERYIDALNCFQYLSGFGENTQYYLSFSWGVCLRMYGGLSLADAIEYFEMASDLEELNSRSLVQIGECRELYREYLLAEGDRCRDNGELDEALTYYEILRNLPDVEGAQRYKECIEMMETPEKSSDVSMLCAAANGEEGVLLTWESRQTEHVVEWSFLGTDISCGNRIVQGNSIQIDGLLPDTAYRFSVRSMQSNDEDTVIEYTVPQPGSWCEQHGGENVYMTLYRYDMEQFQIYTQDGVTPYGNFLRNFPEWRTSLGTDLLLQKFPPAHNGYMAAISFLEKTPDDYIADSTVVRFVLHTDGFGTYDLSQIKEDSGLSVENYAFCLIGPLFERIPAEAYGRPYRLDLIINGLYAASYEGVL